RLVTVRGSGGLLHARAAGDGAETALLNRAVAGGRTTLGNLVAETGAGDNSFGALCAACAGSIAGAGGQIEAARSIDVWRTGRIVVRRHTLGITEATGLNEFARLLESWNRRTAENLIRDLFRRVDCGRVILPLDRLFLDGRRNDRIVELRLGNLHRHLHRLRFRRSLYGDFFNHGLRLGLPWLDDGHGNRRCPILGRHYELVGHENRNNKDGRQREALKAKARPKRACARGAFRKNGLSEYGSVVRFWRHLYPTVRLLIVRREEEGAQYLSTRQQGWAE